MVEKAEHPLPHEMGPRPPEPHDPRGLRPPEPWEMVELRSIAEELITALETEDRDLKTDAVVGVLSRFELKKVEESAQAWERVGLLAYLFRPKKERFEPRP